MIDWLTIKHFAIAASVELELDNGFTAVTGETGSGKSIMVDAIGTLLGARADNSLIQHGQEQAEIQCSFSLPKTHSVFHWLASHDLGCDEEILLRRIIRRDKPSRGFINGNPVNISMLRELGNELLDIHGQHEHHSLMRKPIQQSLLDEAAGNQLTITKIGDCYDTLMQIQRQLDQVNNEQANTQERIDLLTFQLAELDQLRPLEGEWEQLEKKQKRLHHAQELSQGCHAVAARLYLDDDSTHDQLTRLSGQLRQLEKFDPTLDEIASMLDEASVNTEEAARQLQDQAGDAELNPAEILEIEQRFTSFHELSRKHRIQPGLLADHALTLRSELDSLSNPDAERQRLEQEIKVQREHYDKLASKLTATRKSMARKLAKKITAAMQELGMAGGKFEIDLRPHKADALFRSGSESVEFLVTANPGVPLQPLSKIASGGEISRISLAIQVILAGAAKVPTLIFDEVDVGIGGTVANVVGQRLKEIGTSCQVLCVTHLAQVAARADQHFSVDKIEQKSGGIAVSVQKLNDEQRVAEISRMSGSEKLTDQSRAHAEQMLATG